MSFYMGYPLKWRDGEIFGTICVLDRKRNARALLFRDGLQEFARVIETDLALLLEAHSRQRAEAMLQDTLRERQDRVAARTRDLEEANAALWVLITMETATAELHDQLRSKIRGLVRPHLAKLRSGLGALEPHRSHLDLIEADLDCLASDGGNRLVSAFAYLTPTESEIAHMVIHGYSTKAIAERLSRGTSSVDFHRDNIRRKLRVPERRNPRSHLLALS